MCDVLRVDKLHCEAILADLFYEWARQLPDAKHLCIEKRWSTTGRAPVKHVSHPPIIMIALLRCEWWKDYQKSV